MAHVHGVGKGDHEGMRVEGLGTKLATCRRGER